MRSSLTSFASCDTDFLVIGGGIAGLRAALELARHGQVLVVTKGDPAESNTFYAQGGIAVALNDDDHVDLHFTDTVKAGHQLCYEPAAKILVEEGLARVQELIEWGARFDTIDGQLAFTNEGAHSRRRILRAGGDATGGEMVRVLLGQVRREPTIQWLGSHFSVDLLIRSGQCRGALVLDERSRAFLLITARAVVLATGGAGQVYARTTNPSGATGDGMAMALRAGAILQDMEFVQFHPTALYLPSSPPFLISETLRGEGGILRNRSGERFMSRYDPDGELASRDVVARAIWSEMLRTKSPHVYLDVTHLGATFVKKRFPSIYATCLRFDIDITEEWIPVAPSAHYMMGGVKTGLDGETTVPGLFAAGEVACTGVHGANRLASNSLLEGLVFGVRAARAAAAFVPQEGQASLSLPLLECDPRRSHMFSDREKVRRSLRRLMWTKVGLVRSEEALQRACAQLAQWEQTSPTFPVTRDEMELSNLIQVGRCIAEAALWRRNSIGAHFRKDFPSTDDPSWNHHSRSVRTMASSPNRSSSVQAG
ncbi:MAG: L-aspartate oxidase [Nitrospirae bacterium]|nr:MAG: L-aspartate oxidase [Nitrospirota bacterium]